MKPRWRVQAFLTRDHTGSKEWAYEPIFCLTAWGARREFRKLVGSFAGQARFEMERIRSL